MFTILVRPIYISHFVVHARNGRLSHIKSKRTVFGAKLWEEAIEDIYIVRVLLRVLLAQSMPGSVTAHEAHEVPTEKNPTAKAMPRHATATAIANTSNKVWR